MHHTFMRRTLKVMEKPGSIGPMIVSNCIDSTFHPAHSTAAMHHQLCYKLGFLDMTNIEQGGHTLISKLYYRKVLIHAISGCETLTVYLIAESGQILQCNILPN